MGFEQSKRAIASIHHPTSQQIVGTGFLVAECYLLTCAHVIETLGQDWKNLATLIPISFFEAGLDSDASVAPDPSHQAPSHQAKMVWQQLDEPGIYRNDFALLKLTAAAPCEIEPLQLKLLGTSNPSVLQSFGFPSGDTAGRNLTAEFGGEIRGGWVQIEGIGATGLAVEDGFSGAPVWCQASEGWVGMVVARDRRRPEAKVGFIIPTERLSAPLRELRRRTLHDILEPYKQEIADQIVNAYQVCRPEGWLSPYSNRLQPILSDLSSMPDGDAACPRLVQFAAGLLSQTVPPTLRLSLERWVNSETDDLLSLRQTMLERLNASISQPSQQTSAGLLVAVRPHDQKSERYYVNAWLVRDFNAYQPEQWDGVNSLIFKPAMQEDEQKPPLDPENGVTCKDIPILMADYLTQAGNCGIDLRGLTVEIFVPLELLNTAFEQWIIPDADGFPQPLSQDCHVVVRSHERLEGYRQRGRWHAKWKCLKQREDCKAQPLFLPGEENLRQLVKKFDASAEALGLKLSKRPSTERGGELALVLRTGIPIALWVRQPGPTVDWGEKIDARLLNCCLKQVPQQVAAVRRAAPERAAPQPESVPESVPETVPGSVPDLGHHLSFVWEDPHRVPPTIAYSGSAL